MAKKKELLVEGYYIYNGDTKQDAEKNVISMFNKIIKPNIEKYFRECSFSVIGSEEAPEYDDEAGKRYKILFKANFPNPVEELHDKNSDELEFLYKLFYAEITS